MPTIIYKARNLKDIEELFRQRAARAINVRDNSARGLRKVMRDRLTLEAAVWNDAADILSNTQLEPNNG